MNNIKIIIVLLLFSYSSITIVAQGLALKKANEAYEQFGYREAIALYKEVLEEDKQNEQALERLADCYRLVGNTKSAEPAYKRAIKANAKKAILKFYYGKVLMSNEKYSEALAAFNEYKSINKADKLVYNYIDACEHIADLKRDSSAYSINTLPNANSPKSDFSPVFYKDGLVITSFRQPAGSKSTDDQAGSAYADMYYIKKIGVHWTSGAALDGRTSSHYHEGPATFNSQGTVMYFTRNVAKNKAQKSGESHLQICESRWDGKKWSAAEPLSFCSNDYSVGHPSLSADGQKLYFVSNMPGGLGGKDIWVSQMRGGKWQTPEPLGASVNTAGDEAFPFIHPDGTLYFASDGWGGLGGLDIFSAIPIGEDWTVKNMGVPINTAKDDHGLILNDDKTSGYLASNRRRDDDDIYQVDIAHAQAQKLRLLPLVATNETPTLQPIATTAPSDLVASITTKGSPNTMASSLYAEQEGEPVIETQQEIAKIFKEDSRLVVVGIALDKYNKQPLKNARIQLNDLTNHQQREVITQADGNFVFFLQQGSQYNIAILEDNNVRDYKYVSTINPGNTLVFHAILEGNGNSSQPAAQPSKLPDPMPAKRQDELAFMYDGRDGHLNNANYAPTVANSSSPANSDITRPVLPTNSRNQLTFKVQIGSFRQALSPKSRFFGAASTRNIENEVSGSGLYRYLTGNYVSFSEAQTACRSLQKSGYRTAFVVGYLENNRLEMDIQQVLSTYAK